MFLLRVVIVVYNCLIFGTEQLLFKFILITKRNRLITTRIHARSALLCFILSAITISSVCNNLHTRKKSFIQERALVIMAQQGKNFHKATERKNASQKNFQQTLEIISSLMKIR